MSMRTRCVPCLLYHHGICTALAPREAPHSIGDVKTTFFQTRSIMISRRTSGMPLSENKGTRKHASDYKSVLLMEEYNPAFCRAGFTAMELNRQPWSYVILPSSD
jgi:hypothetical protein